MKRFLSICPPNRAVDKLHHEKIVSADPCLRLASQHLPPRHREHVWRQPFERASGVQQQARTGLLTVFRVESAQVHRVTEARAARRLDLDRQETTARLDHEVNLLAD